MSFVYKSVNYCCIMFVFEYVHVEVINQCVREGLDKEDLSEYWVSTVS